MPNAISLPWLRRLAADVALWAGIGVVMAFLGPFGSSERSLPERFEYWLICMVGGGLFGIALDEPVRRGTDHFWARLLAVSVLMTPPVTMRVALTNHFLAGMRLTCSAGAKRGCYRAYGLIDGSLAEWTCSYAMQAGIWIGLSNSTTGIHSATARPVV